MSVRDSEYERPGPVGAVPWYEDRPEPFVSVWQVVAEKEERKEKGAKKGRDEQPAGGRLQGKEYSKLS